MMGAPSNKKYKCLVSMFSLLEQGYDRLTAKKHLLAFALAAPLAAFVAYFGLVRVSSCICRSL